MSRSGTHFHFKQFSIRHDRSTMKVGTDGVLLGAWLDVTNCRKILDIGTGSGVIAIMLAQRTGPETIIEAVEVEKDDAGQAMENASQSPWSDRVTIHHTSIQQFQPQEKYDLIVSNPPYFNNSQKPPVEKRIHVRHTTTLPFTELIDSVNNLLSDTGRFSVIFPFTEGLDFITLASQSHLYCSRKFAFRTRKEKPIERWLLEFSRHEQPVNEGEILLYDEGLNWSASYIGLLRDFYLKI